MLMPDQIMYGKCIFSCFIRSTSIQHNRVAAIAIEARSTSFLCPLTAHVFFLCLMSLIFCSNRHKFLIYKKRQEFYDPQPMHLLLSPWVHGACKILFSGTFEELLMRILILFFQFCFHLFNYLLKTRFLNNIFKLPYLSQLFIQFRTLC